MAGRLRIVAIIAAFNEADIIGQTVRHLIEQGIFVHLIDDGSTDCTDVALAPFLASGLLSVERSAVGSKASGEPGVFQWARLLSRKEQLSRELEGDWFLHYDADEFRESPWGHLDLRHGIELVDRLGYNAIDFAVLNFWPTDADVDVPGDVQRTLRYWEPAASFDRVQVKCWKKTPAIDLVTSGGHDARFDGRSVFPIRFLARHYPFRSQEHGQRKVFAERKPRFVQEERARGWHVQYDGVEAGSSFTRLASALTLYDPDAIRSGLQIEHRGVESLAEERNSLQRTISELGADLEALGDRHRVLTREHDELARSRAELALEHEGLQDTLRKTAVELADTRAQLERADQELARVRARGTESRRTLEQTIEGQAREIENQTREIDALRRSHSWRMTKPLRTVYSIVFRPARRPPLPAAAPARKPLTWGDFSRESPLSEVWGIDRGRPVDRYFIESFLDEHSADVHGHVLEVKDPGYTTRFGGDRVRRSSVLDVDPDNRVATVIGDLATPGGIPLDGVDCFILTQTLHIIYDIEGAVREAVRLLSPGGVLLCTIPAVSRVNYEDGGLERGDFWRLTAAAVRRLFEQLPQVETLEVKTYGNVRTCAAFLYGLAAEELPQDVLDHHDPWFPLLHGVRVVKRA